MPLKLGDSGGVGGGKSIRKEEMKNEYQEQLFSPRPPILQMRKLKDKQLTQFED